MFGRASVTIITQFYRSTVIRIYALEQQCVAVAAVTLAAAGARSIYFILNAFAAVVARKPVASDRASVCASARAAINMEQTVRKHSHKLNI